MIETILATLNYQGGPVFPLTRPLVLHMLTVAQIGYRRRLEVYTAAMKHWCTIRFMLGTAPPPSVTVG